MKDKYDYSIISEKHKQYWCKDDTSLLIFLMLAIYILFTYLIPTYLFVPVNVLGASMEPTLYQNDRVILYKQGDIDYGDIIVVYTPNVYNRETETMGEDIIKRVMGLPGDTVWFEPVTLIINDKNVTVYYFHRKHTVNGMTIETVLKDEYYVLKYSNNIVIYGGNYSGEPVTLSDNEYFVLGDNRGNSLDSRTTKEKPSSDGYVGLINKEDIKGKALFIIRNGKIILVNKIVY